MDATPYEKLSHQPHIPKIEPRQPVPPRSAGDNTAPCKFPTKEYKSSEAGGEHLLAINSPAHLIKYIKSGPDPLSGGRALTRDVLIKSRDSFICGFFCRITWRLRRGGEGIPQRGLVLISRYQRGQWRLIRRRWRSAIARNVAPTPNYAPIAPCAAPTIIVTYNIMVIASLTHKFTLSSMLTKFLC